MDNYGNGPSTGQIQSGVRRVSTLFKPEDLQMSAADRQVLRKLAQKVATIADSPKMAGKRELWRKINSLQKMRPLILCEPENGWNEIITERQMQCTGKMARHWEMDLRKEIFWGQEMGDDKPVEPYFNVPCVLLPDDWGVEIIEHKSDETGGSKAWEPVIKDYDKDLDRLKMPQIIVDWETSKGCLDIAGDTFGDILTVRRKNRWWSSLGITKDFIKLRGLMNLFSDFYDHPAGLKALLAFISNVNLAKLDFLEVNNLLSLNNDGTYIGSGGYGFSDELPQPDFDGKVRIVDLWGYTDSQETINVSPEHYAEFVFPAEKPLMDRFGLTCYGCCEELHTRWHVVKKHHNLRRVSCSPWGDIEKMSANLEDKYVFSMKPSPTPLSMPRLDLDTVRHDLRKALEMTRDNVVEVIMKDNHTLGNRPENAVEWSRMAKQEARRVSGIR
jgi:hypothetical protein